MRDLEEVSLERMKALQLALIRETEKIAEIIRLIDSGWSDPGAELIKKAMKAQQKKLEEQANILQSRIRMAQGEGGITEINKWEEEED